MVPDTPTPAPIDQTGASVRELPMFPLGSVLFPHMVLPLHVFEPRYRALVQDVLDGDGEFGVVLISRGHEVGGGDVRTDVGTVARVIQAEPLDEDRWFVIAVGTRRIRVEGWLPDDPYPRAEVADLDDDPVGPEIDEHLARLGPQLRRVLALQAGLGQDNVPATFEFTEDPAVAGWQAAVLSPLTPYDAQQVLVTGDPVARLELVAELLSDAEETLRLQLQQEG